MSKPLGQRRSRLTDLRFSSTRFRSDDAPAARRRLLAEEHERWRRSDTRCLRQEPVQPALHRQGFFFSHSLFCSTDCEARPQRGTGFNARYMACARHPLGSLSSGPAVTGCVSVPVGGKDADALSKCRCCCLRGNSPGWMRHEAAGRNGQFETSHASRCVRCVDDVEGGFSLVQPVPSGPR